MERDELTVIAVGDIGKVGDNVGVAVDGSQNKRAPSTANENGSPLTGPSQKFVEVRGAIRQLGD